MIFCLRLLLPFRSIALFGNIESQDFHAELKEGFRLVEIEKIEFDFSLFGEVTFDLEKEPLSVPVGIDIILQYTVVFSIGYFDGKSEVAALKNGVKLQSIFLHRPVKRMNHSLRWDGLLLLVHRL